MTIPCYNPSLSEEPRNQPLKVLPPIIQESILSWLERTGRFQPREDMGEFQDPRLSEELDDFLESEVYESENEEESQE